MSAGFARHARTADIPDIVECTYAQWTLRVADESRLPSREELANTWELLLAGGGPPGVQTIVATEADAVKGWLLLAPSPDEDSQARAAEILDFVVHPSAHGRGHGSRLIHAAADLRRQAGEELLSMWVLAINETLRGFLLAQGFGPDGAWRELAPPLGEEDNPPREFRYIASLAPESD